MGQAWLLFNLTRGTCTCCGPSRMLEFAPYRCVHANLAAALRPGSAWSGHRLVLSGDYDTNRSHMVAYVRAHGLAFAEGVERISALYGCSEPELDWPPRNLYYLVTDGPLSHTSDTEKLRSS